MGAGRRTAPGVPQQFNVYAKGLGFARTRMVDYLHHFARRGLRIVVDLHVIHHRTTRNPFRLDQIEPVLVWCWF